MMNIYQCARSRHVNSKNKVGDYRKALVTIWKSLRIGVAGLVAIFLLTQWFIPDSVFTRV